MRDLKNKSISLYRKNNISRENPTLNIFITKLSDSFRVILEIILIPSLTALAPRSIIILDIDLSHFLLFYQDRQKMAF